MTDELLAQIERRLAKLEQTLVGLADDIRAILRRDASQEQRLAALEIEAVASGKRATQSSRIKWGTIAAGIATVIALLLERLLGP